MTSQPVWEDVQPNLLNELIFGERRLEEFHLVTLRRQDITAGLVHILQQQNLDVLGREGFEVFRIRHGDYPLKSGTVAGGRVE